MPSRFGFWWFADRVVGSTARTVRLLLILIVVVALAAGALVTARAAGGLEVGPVKVGEGTVLVLGVAAAVHVGRRLWGVIRQLRLSRVDRRAATRLHVVTN